MSRIFRIHVALLVMLVSAIFAAHRGGLISPASEWVAWLFIGLVGGIVLSLGVLNRLEASRWRSTTPLITTDATGRLTDANLAATALFGAPLDELNGQRVQVGENIAWPERIAAVAELTRGIAHELRNPLTAVRNAAQLGLMFADPAKKDELFQEVIIQADRLNESIDDLTTFATSDAGPLAPVRLDQVVATALAQIKGILIMRDIKVDCAFSGSVPPVLGREQQLKQAILNIFNTSIQAMPGGGALIIRSAYHNDEKRLELTIGDTGAGIAPRAVARVFRPFAVHTGSNIGLTIASQIIVQGHNGTITCQSSIGGGTRIRLMLPACVASGQPGQLSADNAN